MAVKTHTVFSFIRGHHVSKHFWTPTTGETLQTEREPDNEHNIFAVAVIHDQGIVGQYLWSSRSSFWLLRRSVLVDIKQETFSSLGACEKKSVIVDSHGKLF